MRRRDFIGGLPAVVALGLPPSGFAQQRSSDRRPNVIFIFADDLGWGDLGCYGNSNIKTPNIDRLARQGTLFSQFYVSSGVCSPSRTAFMTGHYPARHRIHGHIAAEEQNAQRGMPNFLDAEAHTVTRLLQQAGYKTGHFGKWHLGHGEGAPGPGAYGIDDHRTTTSNGPSWPKPEYYWAKLTELIVDESIRFIEENRAHPFYLNVWSLIPYAVLDPTEEQMKPYRRFGPNRPENLPYKGAMQIYYASVSDLDQQIGRLLDKLDELGLAENTLVVFSSDNGPEDIHVRNASHSAAGSSGPFRGRKRSLYEGGVRTPFIARWPGRVPAGRVDDESLVTAVDFLPTVCKLAGVEVPGGLNPDGEDVSDVLLGASRNRKKAIFWEWRFRITGHVSNRSPMLSVRDGGYKLLMNPDRSRVELYDIPNDPRERHNLAEHRPEIVERLSKKLLAWQKTLAPGPIDPGAGGDGYPWPKASPP